MPPPTPTSGPMQPLNVPSKPSKNICFLSTGSGLFELIVANFNLGALQAEWANLGMKRAHRRIIEHKQSGSASRVPTYGKAHPPCSFKAGEGFMRYNTYTSQILMVTRPQACASIDVTSPDLTHHAISPSFFPDKIKIIFSSSAVPDDIRELRVAVRVATAAAADQRPHPPTKCLLMRPHPVKSLEHTLPPVTLFA